MSISISTEVFVTGRKILQTEKNCAHTYTHALWTFSPISLQKKVMNCLKQYLFIDQIKAKHQSLLNNSWIKRTSRSAIGKAPQTYKTSSTVHSWFTVRTVKSAVHMQKNIFISIDWGVNHFIVKNWKDSLNPAKKRKNVRWRTLSLFSADWRRKYHLWCS